jgi:hypothetical protein
MNPVDREVADDAARDHAQAGARGRRVLDLTNAVLSALQATGLIVFDPDEARVAIFSVLAEDIYGNAAVDIPTLRSS